MNRTVVIVGAVAATLVALCAFGGIVAVATSPNQPNNRPTPAAARPTDRPNDAAPTRGVIADPKTGMGAVTDPTTAPTPPLPHKPAGITDGEWTVGDDITAGTYKVAAPIPADAFCYWEITKAGSNGRDIIANDIPKGGRPSVTLKAGQVFETNGCGTWEKTA